MTTKHYLPSPVLSFDIEEIRDKIMPTIERHTERHAPSHVKLPRYLRRCLPIFSIFAMLFGTAFLGFSFVIVNEGNVGYYSPSKECRDCPVKLLDPGTYFSLPWSKGTFSIADITDKNLTVGTIPGFEPNGTCVTLQQVKNVTEYVTSIVLFSETRLTSEVIALLKTALSTTLGFANFTYSAYGLSFTKPHFV